MKTQNSIKTGIPTSATTCEQLSQWPEARERKELFLADANSDHLIHAYTPPMFSGVYSVESGPLEQL